MNLTQLKVPVLSFPDFMGIPNIMWSKNEMMEVVQGNKKKGAR